MTGQWCKKSETWHVSFAQIQCEVHTQVSDASHYPGAGDSQTYRGKVIMASKHEREMGRMMYLAYTLTYLEQNTSVDDWSELSNEDQ